MSYNLNRIAGRTSLIYWVLAGLYILFSDSLMGFLIRDVEAFRRLEVYKGLGFVTVTSILLYLVLRNQLNHLRHAQNALRKNEEKYRNLFENMSEGFVLHEIISDEQGRPCDFRFLEMNAACELLTGLVREEAVGRGLLEITGESSWIERYSHVALTGEPQHFEEYIPLLKRWLEFFAFRPNPGECAVVFSDITERKNIEKALQDSENQLRTLIRTIPDLVWLKDPQGVYLACNSRFESFFGAEEKDIIGKTDYDFMDEKLAEFFREHDQAAVAKAQASVNEEQVTFASDGHREILETIKTPIYTNEGQVAGVLGIGRDITGRKKAEAERERLMAAIEQVGEMIVITNPDGSIQYVNPAFEHTTGYRREEVIGQNPRILKSDSHDPAFYQSLWETISGGRTWKGHVVNKRKDGSTFTEAATISPVRDALGQIVNYVAVKRDITERLNLEAQFRQAQKMESVGRLAGGVAHDFNNILSVIIGYTELALDKVEPSDPLHADLEEVYKAARRSTDIIRQLLAFAREQTVRPKVLDLNETVEGMLKMLRRLIGEDIDLLWKPGKGQLCVKIDPSQIDQVLANLCVNARDAIADVGKITIETSTETLDEAYCSRHAGFVPGEFVLLAVSDDGGGMDKATLDNIFEPFFTTKEVGKGTGLGLPTVYGIVKQNNGFINVYSEPDKGTTLKIYLPQHQGRTVEGHRESGAEIPLSRGETVLLVEDDAGILKLSRKILEDLGYTVLSASAPADAMDLARKHTGKIHLLVTDVVMPGMNGRELADQLQARYANLKILFMSGYTANVIAHRGVLEEGVCFISKPFSKREFSVMVRAVLDSISQDD
jgi:PAS domain S-box-containing protein